MRTSEKSNNIVWYLSESMRAIWRDSYLTLGAAAIWVRGNKWKPAVAIKMFSEYTSIFCHKQITKYVRKKILLRTLELTELYTWMICLFYYEYYTLIDKHVNSIFCSFRIGILHLLCILKWKSKTSYEHNNMFNSLKYSNWFWTKKTSYSQDVYDDLIFTVEKQESS